MDFYRHTLSLDSIRRFVKRYILKSRILKRLLADLDAEAITNDQNFEDGIFQGFAMSQRIYVTFSVISAALSRPSKFEHFAVHAFVQTYAVQRSELKLAHEGHLCRTERTDRTET